MKKFIFLGIAAITVLTFAVFSLAGCKPETNAESTSRLTCTVSYAADGNVSFKEEVNYGECAPVPPKDETDGARFTEWIYNAKPYDFTQPVTHDITLTARYRVYSVNFVVDGKIINSFEYEFYNQKIKEPPLPVKDGYNGNWEEYSLTGGDIRVNAVYTPVNYNLKFIIDGEVIRECICTIENFTEFLPSAPEKFGYEFNWISKPCGENSYEIHGEYTPAIFTFYYYAEGELVAKRVTTFGEEYDEPEIPEKEHYDGSWGETVFTDEETAEVHAIYSPKKYEVKFIAENEFFTRTYDIENPSVDIPTVPEKTHYTGRWQDFILDGGDKVVYAEYTPVTYEVRFVADGVTVAVEYYTVENASVTIPPVPAKEYCNGEWEKFELKGGNLTVNAIYTRVNGTEGLEYSADGDGLKVVGYSGTEQSVIIPTERDGRRVTAIADEAFANNCTVADITICKGVQSIGASAFNNCKSLKSIELPDTITTINQGAFMNCTALTHIDLPDNLTVLSESIFSESGLESVKLPENLLRIERNAFSNCLNLKSVTIPDATEEICTAAFANCARLESVIFGTGLKILREYAFLHCYELVYVKFKITEDWHCISGTTTIDVSSIFPDPAATAKLFRNNIFELTRK